MNATIPPSNTNPTAPATTATAAATREHQHLSNNAHSTTHATTGAHTAVGGSKMEGIKATLHDIKDSVKETLQRDHHHGADCAKKPQDGKTNPME